MATATARRQIAFIRTPEGAFTLADRNDRRFCQSFAFDLGGDTFCSYSEVMAQAIQDLTRDGFDVVFRAVR